MGFGHVCLCSERRLQAQSVLEGALHSGRSRAPDVPHHRGKVAWNNILLRPVSRAGHYIQQPEGDNNSQEEIRTGTVVNSVKQNL